MLSEEKKDPAAASGSGDTPNPAAQTADARRPSGPQRQGKGGRPRQRPDAKKDDGSIERVIQLNRVSKVTKGGKNFSFNAVVVCGDGKGNVGVGIGKANEVSDAIIKGASRAKKNYVRVMVVNNTIPHEVIGKFKASNVFLKPAGAGTGVIAGASVRALCDAAGIKNILTKCLGSRTPLNILMATLNGFGQLRTTRRG